ncbi:hypothetical protein ACQKWADRAFT_179497 [Trichoderma austrokoningii]
MTRRPRPSTSQSVYILLLVLLLLLLLPLELAVVSCHLLRGEPSYSPVSSLSLALSRCVGPGKPFLCGACFFGNTAHKSSLPLHGPSFDLDL